MATAPLTEGTSLDNLREEATGDVANEQVRVSEKDAEKIIDESDKGDD